MTKRACSICIHSDRTTIDSQLFANVNQKDIAAQFSVSKFALSRHWRKCCAPAAPAADNDSLEAQATMWRERADALWQQATADADSRAMAQAVSAGLRSVELQARQKEREAAAASEPDTGPLTLQEIDRVRTAWDQVQAESDERTTQLAMAESQRLRCPDLYAVFVKLWSAPVLKQRVLEFCEELFTTETTENELLSQIPN